MNAMIGLLAPLLIGGEFGSAGAVERVANYQPPGSPGGGNNWAGEQQPLKTRWGVQPSSNVTTGTTSGENSRYAGQPMNPIPTPVPISGSTPTSTAGFPINPNATPTSATSTFPGPTLGTIPSPPSSTIATSPPSPFPGSSSSSAFPGSTLPSSTLPNSSLPSSSSAGGAWPTVTAPPSLGAGPRITQPQPWSALPRESTVSARMPAEPNLPTPNLGTLQPGYNVYGNTPPATYQQPGYGQTQVAQLNYPPPSATPTGPQFPGNYANGGQPQPGYPTGAQPMGAQPTTNAGVTLAANTNPTKEPASASDKSQTKPTEAQWLPLTLTLILLGTSIACNLYFGWSKYQMQERYRLLLVDRGGYAS